MSQEMTDDQVAELLREFDVENCYPVGWKYLVQVEISQTKTESGIILAQTSERMLKNNSTVAKILRAGPLCNINHGSGKPWAKVGDRVHILIHAGTTIRTRSGSDNSPFKYINDDDINGLIVE